MEGGHPRFLQCRNMFSDFKDKASICHLSNIQTIQQYITTVKWKTFACSFRPAQQMSCVDGLLDAPPSLPFIHISLPSVPSFPILSLCRSYLPSLPPSAHPTVCPLSHLSVRLSIHVSICLFIHPSIHPSICLAIHLLFCPYIHPPIHLSIHLSVHPFIVPTHPSFSANS